MSVGRAMVRSSIHPIKTPLAAGDNATLFGNLVDKGVDAISCNDSDNSAITVLSYHVGGGIGRIVVIDQVLTYLIVLELGAALSRLSDKPP